MKETEIFQKLNAERRPEEPDSESNIRSLSIKTSGGEAELKVSLKDGSSFKVTARDPGNNGDPLDETTNKNLACVVLALDEFFKRKKKHGISQHS